MELLDILGLPYIQAEGEAEATCAALNYHKVSIVFVMFLILKFLRYFLIRFKNIFVLKLFPK